LVDLLHARFIATVFLLSRFFGEVRKRTNPPALWEENPCGLV
jgi:hypothetical protein